MILVKVKNIRFVNNKVEIILDEKTICISKENYIDNPMTIDSFVNEEQIRYLLDYERVIESKIELIKMLNKKALTEHEIINRLKDKEITGQDIKMIVESLKRAGLINDEYVGILWVESLLVKRVGKLEIIRKLREKGIDDEISNKLISEIDEIVYEDNFYKVCEKYLKMYDNKGHKLKEQLVTNKLREKGYEEEYIKRIRVDKNDEEELKKVKQTLLKLLKDYKLSSISGEKLNKIKSKLVNKGFNYAIINLAIEEVKENEAY